MEAHIGMDSKLKIVHSFAATPADVHDSHILSELLPGEETRLWGDAAYCGKRAAIRAHAPRAADFTQHWSARRKGLSVREQRVHRNKARARSG
jgi:IS5 family transposase